MLMIRHSLALNVRCLAVGDKERWCGNLSRIDVGDPPKKSKTQINGADGQVFTWVLRKRSASRSKYQSWTSEWNPTASHVNSRDRSRAGGVQALQPLNVIRDHYSLVFGGATASTLVAVLLDPSTINLSSSTIRVNYLMRGFNKTVKYHGALPWEQVEYLPTTSLIHL